MLRRLLTVVLLAAAAFVALWQFDVIDLPLAGREAPSDPLPGLFEAVRVGDPEALEQVLATATVVDPKDEYGQTPLIYAITASSSPEVLTALIEAGADVNVAAQGGWTPLMYAARDGNAKTVQLLLFAGADPSLVNDEGNSAYDIALRNPAIASGRLLARLQELSERPFNRDWPSGYTVPVEGATISSRSTHLPGALRAYRNGTHEGFDFYDGTVSVSIDYGTPIHAVADGIVIRADHGYQEMSQEEYDEVIATAQRSLSTPAETLDRLRGRQVWIRHPGGFVTRYAHLSAISEWVTEGVQVSQGDFIAATGNSGTLEAAQGTRDDPHPHVEIWRGDERYLGFGMTACEIYTLAAQVFGSESLPPFTEECPDI